MSSILEKLKSVRLHETANNVGVVERVEEGVIFIKQLRNVFFGEVLLVNNSIKSLVISLEENIVGAILLSNELISAGDFVYSTGESLSVKVSTELKGRVINPVGNFLDNGKPLNDYIERNVESESISILDRGRVESPLYTGIKAIDSMIPIGKGQRELIIGDRETGKTTIAIDTIINQKDKDVICVYVAIGQKASNINRIINILKKYNSFKHTIIVSSNAEDNSALQYIAPYTGCTIAEHFMLQGKDCLVIYDDLTKHAKAYRTISLLLKRPPGREAYPGDIFYLHSKLLERAVKMSKQLGGGSITALPIVETQQGDISAYIPTNVISITDGQIYLEKDLFNAGIRPAINVGLSVSRVGGNAQCKAMKKISKDMRLKLSHFKEMSIFAQFSSDIDSKTHDIIKKGEILVESLKQPQYSPLSVEKEILTFYLLSNKKVNTLIDKEDIREFIEDFLIFISIHNENLVYKIANQNCLSEEDNKLLDKLINGFVYYFVRNKDAKSE